MRDPDLFTWNRLKGRFLQVNTWLIIALLALAGWTIDALRLFLNMHESLRAGLGAFAGHFWFAVPMTVVIIVLTRLQPRARLLGLAAYDETGRLVHHQGEFQPAELTVRGMLAALWSNGERVKRCLAYLHGITLPSGTSVYFTREEGLTLMAKRTSSPFSRPAPSQALADSVLELGAEIPPAFNLLNGLEPPLAALAANVLASPVKRDVLGFLYRYGQTAMQAGDLAYWVDADEDAVRQALESLAELDLVQSLCACDLTFYHLNRDREVSARLDKLFAWQGKWQAQLHRLERMIG